MQSKHVPALKFRPDSISTTTSSSSSAASSTIYPTTSSISSSIASGIGASSGRFILGVGKTILQRVENVTVIRRRLAYIQDRCPLFDDKPPENVLHIYDDLLELARCASELLILR
jgi:hypothetical protein